MAAGAAARLREASLARHLVDWHSLETQRAAAEAASAEETMPGDARLVGEDSADAAAATGGQRRRRLLEAAEDGGSGSSGGSKGAGEENMSQGFESVEGAAESTSAVLGSLVQRLREAGGPLLAELLGADVVGGGQGLRLDLSR